MTGDSFKWEERVGGCGVDSAVIIHGERSESCIAF